MPERPGPEDLPSIAWRVAALERAHQETRAEMSTAIAQAKQHAEDLHGELEHELHERYLTRQETTLQFPSIAAHQGRIARHQAWGVYVVGIIVAVGEIFTIIHGILG